MIDGKDIDGEDVRWRGCSMARMFEGITNIRWREFTVVKMFDGEDIRSRGCSNARMFGGWCVLLDDEKTTYKQRR